MSKRHLKYLLATTLTTSLTALADTPNVNVYGVANLSFDAIDTGIATNGTKGTRITKVSSNASRIGLKGSEEIDSDMAAIWQVESLVAIDNAGGTFATRNSFAGLNSKSLGTVLLGRYDTPYKISTRKLDNFSDSIADNRSLFGTVSGTSASTAFDGRQPDVIAYTSPMLAGFSSSIAYVNLNEAATTATAARAKATSLAATYDNGMLYAALAYEYHHLNTVRIGATESAWRAGIGYTLDDYSFGAAYEKTRDTLGGATAPAACTALAAKSDCLGHSALYLTGKYTFGSNALKLAYTKVGNLGAAANTGASQFSLGYDHRLTKRSTLFAVYTRLSNESKANYGLGNTAFSSGAVTSIGAGADPAAISLGMKYAF